MEELKVVLHHGDIREQISCQREKLMEAVAKRLKLEGPFTLEKLDKVDYEWIPVSPSELEDACSVRVILDKDLGHSASDSSRPKSMEKDYDNTTKKIKDDPHSERNTAESDDSEFSSDSDSSLDAGDIDDSSESSETVDKEDDDDIDGSDSSETADRKEEKLKAVRDLKAQMSNFCASGNEIDSVMAKTFEARRRFISVYLPRIQLLHEIYPQLLSVQQVLQEFQRMQDPVLPCRNFKSNVQLFKGTILHYTSGLVNAKQICAKRLEELESIRQSFGIKQEECALKNKPMFKDESEVLKHEQYITGACALLVLPLLLDEKVDDIIAFEGAECRWTFPFIVCDVSIEKALSFDTNPAMYKIYVDKLETCETNNLIDAFLIFCASFYVFNIEYPKVVVNTMAIFERVFLEINPEIEQPAELVIEIEKFLRVLAPRFP